MTQKSVTVGELYGDEVEIISRSFRWRQTHRQGYQNLYEGQVVAEKM